MPEQLSNRSPERSGARSPEQQREFDEQRERLRQERERNAEREQSHERGVEESQERKNAERLAESAERQKPQEKAVEKAPDQRRDQPASTRERDQAYESIMSDARSHMSPARQTFSKFIHNRAVETASNAVGATVARPNAILAGSFTAFVVVLAVFLIARYYGYPLSGSESIVAFAGGWVLGIVFDYLRILISGRR